MAQENNIKLNIEKSLSFTIDKQLDSELRTDVKLNYSQWQSVFDIIKQDNATQTKQYSGGDADIKSGKSYVVMQNQIFEITKKAWDQILNIAKQTAGINQTSTVNTEETGPEDKTVAKEEKSNEENLRTILNEANIQVNDEEILDILAKYENKLRVKDQMNYTDNQIAKDIQDYARGKLYEKTENTFYSQFKENILPNDSKATTDGFVIDGVQKALDYAKENTNGLARALSIQKEGYKSFGNSQVQLYDTNGDNKVDFNEFMEYESKRVNDTYDDAEKTNAKKIFDFLDMNNDNNIDLDEMTSHSYAMSKMTDDANTRTGQEISYNDWFCTQGALAAVAEDNNSSEFQKARTRYEQLRNMGAENLK